MDKLEDYIEDVQRQIGYHFYDTKLLFQAFTRRSYSQENGGENNEVLEFIGDEVLDFYVTKVLIDKYGYINSDNEFWMDENMAEGSLTNIKKKLVNKKMLAKRIDDMGFNEYLIMGKGDIQNNKQDESSVKEDLFEAILGAIAVDSGWDGECLETSVSFMLNIDYYLDNGFTDEDDFVSLIQQWNQKENGEVPEYEFQELNQEGYGAYLYLETERGQMRYYGEGNSKSEARAVAAKNAYNDLDENDELFTIMDELPDELNLDNAINTLQELAQKGYISMPIYELSDNQIYDNDGNLRWQCECYVESHSIRDLALGSTKKIAKKYAAYLCICDICNLKNEYESEDDE